MAVYKISDIADSLLSALYEGHEFVEISELTPDPSEEDPDYSDALFLSYIEENFDDYSSGTEDFIDSVEVPHDYSFYNREDSKDDLLPMVLTREEFILLRDALTNAITRVSDLSKKPSYTADQKKNMKHLVASWRSIKEKIQ